MWAKDPALPGWMRLYEFRTDCPINSTDIEVVNFHTFAHYSSRFTHNLFLMHRRECEKYTLFGDLLTVTKYMGDKAEITTIPLKSAGQLRKLLKQHFDISITRIEAHRLYRLNSVTAEADFTVHPLPLIPLSRPIFSPLTVILSLAVGVGVGIYLSHHYKLI